jgi:hypothetical protein
MKNTILFVGVLLISTCTFASTQALSLKALGSAWKTKQSIQPKQDKNDITIVYGGADISRRPTLVPHTTTA